MHGGSKDRSGNDVHGLARSRLPHANSAEHLRQVTRRVLLPPLLISLAIVSAATLLLTAAAIAPPPVPAAVAAPPLPATAVATLRAETSITTLGQTAGVALPLTPAVVDLARLIYAPGASGPRRALPGPLLLAIESGALTVDLGGAAQRLRPDRVTTVAAGELTLRAGDGLVLPLAISAAVHNDGPVPVVALAAGVFPAGAAAWIMGRSGPARWADDWSPGATVQPLVGGWLVDPPSGPAVIALRRLFIRPEASGPLTAKGPVVLAVEAGAPRMVAERGSVWRQPPDGPDAWLDSASEVTLLPDDGALLHEESSVTLRNEGSGPALVLVLTVEPAANATPLAMTRLT
jgi:quercetin dioxygenase-like cupin family protein